MISGLILSGCYMIPMAFIGPATSSFSTASIIQSAVTTTASQVVKKNTGKSISEHVFGSINNEKVLKQSFANSETKQTIILPKSKP